MLFAYLLSRNNTCYDDQKFDAVFREIMLTVIRKLSDDFDKTPAQVLC